MTHMPKAICLALTTFFISQSATAELMSVKDVKDFFSQGDQGRTIGVSYSQGVFDGLISMEGARRHEGKDGEEFCGLFDAYERGEPVRHPAYRTEELIDAWEQHGRDMEAAFGDLALSYLSGQYGC
nr:hypothetical protein [Halomonas sp. 1513]